MTVGSDPQDPLHWLPVWERRGLDVSPPKLMPLAQCLPILGISRSGAYRLIARDEFPVPTRKVGKRWFVWRADVEAVAGSDWASEPAWSAMTNGELRDAVKQLSETRKTVPLGLALELSVRLDPP